MLVLNTIKATGSDGIKRAELLEKTCESLAVSYGTVDTYVQELCEKGKVRKERLGSSKFDGVKYIFIDPTVKLEATKKEETVVESVTTTDHVDDLNGRFSSGKNDEGYPDPTASAVIESESSDIQIRGEIWSRRDSKGDTHDFLVVASNGTFVTGIQLKTAVYNDITDEELAHHFESKRGITYYYDPVRLTTIPAKFCKATRQATSKEEYNKVISEINRYLGFVAAEPKTVEVVKEVPVEVVKEVVKEVEVPVGDSDEIDRLRNQIRVLEAKISVYKECIQAFGNS
jgi:hypothetical protein